MQLVIAPPSPAPIPLADDPVMMLGDAQERMTVPVSINQRGPWDFIIDTGAERTVVSRELAGVLGLVAGPDVRVTAMTGTTREQTVIVPALSVSSIARETIAAPALELRNIGAKGMLGVDALQGHAIQIDFDDNRMTLRPAKKRRNAAASSGDEIVVVAKSLYGQLIVTDARYRGTRIAVIVDTGSPVTIGNSALLAAITRPRALGAIRVVSAVGGVLSADSFAVNDLWIGGVGFENVPIAFADAPPFKRFGLEKTPALLLGMDALRLFRKVQIDFANREIRFTFPRKAMTAVGVSYTPTRL